MVVPLKDTFPVPELYVPLLVQLPVVSICPVETVNVAPLSMVIFPDVSLEVATVKDELFFIVTDFAVAFVVNVLVEFQ